MCITNMSALTPKLTVEAKFANVRAHVHTTNNSHQHHHFTHNFDVPQTLEQVTDFTCIYHSLGHTTEISSETLYHQKVQRV